MSYKISRFTNLYLSAQFTHQKGILEVLYESVEVQIQEIIFSTSRLKTTSATKLFCCKVGLDM